MGTFSEEEKLSERRVKITKPRLIAGIIMFIIAGITAYLTVKTLLLSTPEQGQIPMLILFGGICVIFILMGIYMFVCEYLLKKSVITFFAGLAAIVIGAIIAVYISNH